jgi:hypothetical protein
MAKNSIEIKYDFNSESLEIASDRTLSLAEKQKILLRQLQKTPEGTKEFNILNNALNDTRDAMDRVALKSKDIYGSLSILPGPIGNISSSVNQAVDAFKIFGGFTTSDVRAQFKNLGADIGDVVKVIGRFTGLSKLTDFLLGTKKKNEEFSKSIKDQTAAWKEAYKAGDANAGALRKTLEATKGAEKGFGGLRTAIISTGVGALVAGLGLLIANFETVKKVIFNFIPGLKSVADFFGSIVTAVTDFVGITSEADRNVEKFNKKMDRTAENLEAEIALLEAQGASAKEIHDKKVQLIDIELQKLRNTLKEKGTLTEEEAKQFRDFKNQMAIENAGFAKQEADAAAAAKKEAADAAKQAAAEALARKKSENQALIDLELAKNDIDEKELRKLLDKKLELEKLSGVARTKAIKDNEKIIDAALAGEIDRAKELAKSQDALADSAKVKSKDTIQALKDEQAQRKETFDIESKAITDKMALYDKDSVEYQALITAKNNLDAGYVKAQTDSNLAIEDAKRANAEKLAEIDQQIADESLAAMQEGLEKQKKEIEKDGDAKKAAFKKTLDSSLETGAITAEQYAEKLKTFNAAVTQEVKDATNAAIGEDFWNKLDENMNSAMLKAEGNFQKTKEAVENSQKDLDKAYADGIITQDAYTQATLTNEALMRESRQQNIAAVGGLGDAVGSLAQAMGEESAAGQVLIKIQQALALSATAMALADAFAGLGKDLKKGFPTNIIAIASTLALMATAVTQFKSLLGKSPKDLGKVSATAAAPAAAPTGSKFANGGLLDGPSHSQGGIKTSFGELEGGEFVVNKRSTRSFMPLLNAINNTGNKRYADGGITPSMADLQAMMSNNQSTTIKTYVVASDVYSQAEADKKIANLARL